MRLGSLLWVTPFVFSLLGAPQAALADTWASPQALERGSMQSGHFVPDPPDGSGRYFRVGEQDDSVFYGVGNNPLLDALWPSYRVNSHLQELLRASPGAYNSLLAYEDSQSGLASTAQLGGLALAGGLLAAAAGLIYDNLPNNPSEMVPSFYLGAGGAALAGGIVYFGARWLAGQNEMFLNQALMTYNRDEAAPPAPGAAPDGM